MKMLLVISFLALFAVPLGLGHVSHDLVSRSSPSPSAQETPTTADSSEPSRVTFATTSESKAPEAEFARAPSVAVVAPPTPTPPAPVPPPQPSATPAASSSASVSADFIASVEAEILRRTNIERAKEGLSALEPDAKLRAIAAAHSADMLANDYFSHDNLAGCSSSCRATNAGYRWRTIGENIYMMSGYRLSPERIAAMMVEGWMNSPGHRANILGASFTEAGIGVVREGSSIYATALHAAPR